jgi:hypothetical protein
MRNFVWKSSNGLPDVAPEPPAARVKRSAAGDSKPTKETNLSLLVDPTVFSLWIVSEKMLDDETRSNWCGSTAPNTAPHKGDADFTCQVKLFQPEHAEMLVETTRMFPLNDMGRITVDPSKMNDSQVSLWSKLLVGEFVGVVCDWSHLAWAPPVRIAGQFGRYVTNSHDYVARDPRSRIRVQFHQDMFVPLPHANVGRAIGDDNSEPDMDDDQGHADPADLVVSADLAVFFSGHRAWVVEGERREIDKFVARHMGQLKDIYRLINSGYAQYLVPRIPPSHRF